MGERDAVVSARRALGKLLSEQRRAAGLTQYDLARLVAYSRTTLANVETGRQNAARDFWASVDEALGAAGSLVSEHDAIEAAMEASRVERVRMARQRRISRAADAPFPFVAGSTGPMQTDGFGAPEPGAVRAVSEAFQAADRRVGGGRLYSAVLAYLRAEIAPRLVLSNGGPPLFAAAASLTEVAAWMAHDSGADVLARQHFGQAYRLAITAEEPALLANICAGMSHLAGQLNEPRDAVRLAQIGLEKLRPGRGHFGLVARLHALRARGLAAVDDVPGGRAALREAERALARSGDDAPGEWISPFDQGSLSAEASAVLRQIGDLPCAEEHADQVLSLRVGDRVRSRAFGQLSLAEIYVAQRRLDEAAILGAAVCTVAPTIASARVRSQLDRLGARLRPHDGVGVVDDFLRKLTAMGAVPPTRTEWPV